MEMTSPNREASDSLAIQIQRGAVQVACRRLHRSDVIPPCVYADERLLREFLGLSRAPGQEQARARKPRIFAAEELDEVLVRRRHLSEGSHPPHMNPYDAAAVS
jgi:hypothetical protein